MSDHEVVNIHRNAPQDADPLIRLRLPAVDLIALQRGGSITQEQRGRETVIFKLRYRRGGRQVVKYLGTDRQFVEEVRARLTALQIPCRCRRRLRGITAEARRQARQVKESVKPHLEQAGWKLHGHMIRRSRTATDHT